MNTGMARAGDRGNPSAGNLHPALAPRSLHGQKADSTSLYKAPTAPSGIGAIPAARGTAGNPSAGNLHPALAPRSLHRQKADSTSLYLSLIHISEPTRRT